MSIAESIQGRGKPQWELHWSVGIQASGLGLGLLAMRKGHLLSLSTGLIEGPFQGAEPMPP